MLISSWICMKFNPWSFVHCRFMNDISWMLIHKIWILLVQLFLSSLYRLPNSTLPNHEVQVTIWLFCKINFSGLWSPLCQIIKSTVPNCQVHVAKSAFRFHTTKATLPNCQVQICFVNCPQHKKILAVQCLIFFRSAETSAQKNHTLSKFKLPSRLNFNILIANWKVLSSHFIFLYIHFYEWCGFKAILMEQKFI
jgi:hypothetical protein